MQRHGESLINWPARRVIAALKSGELAAAEVLDAAIARIEAVDPVVNAIPIRDFDRARDRAVKGIDPSALLAGLPVAIKDLTDVAGLPTTLGDPGVTENAPVSDAVVTRLESNGACIVGKTNVPFLGLGRDTYNPRFGLTVNPWNTDYSTAGSSGGAAAALASGMAWLAHGTDLGGSIRGPASHCGVTGLRPSPGRVGHGGVGTRRMPLDMLNVDGPMARDVRDLALFMDAMAGFCRHDPYAMPHESGACARAADRPALPREMIVMADMDGVSPEADVRDVFDTVIARLLAESVEHVNPGLSFAGIADAAYHLRLGATRARTTPEHENRIAQHLPELASATYDDARALTLDAYLAAGERQQQLVRDMSAHLSDDRILITPAVSYAPMKHGRADPGRPMPIGHWAREAVFAYGITLSLCPALVIPAGFSAAGLPIGIQLVGPPRGDIALFSVARAIEQLLDMPPPAPLFHQGAVEGVVPT